MQRTAIKALDAGKMAARSVVERNRPGSLEWHYETGLILQALSKLAEATSDRGLSVYVQQQIDALVSPEGTIIGYRIDEYNLDQVNAGKILLELAARYSEKPYATAADRLRAQLADQPRTAVGVFWHKKIYPFQIWLDGLYMQAPFAVRYGLERSDSDLVDDVCDQLVITADKTRDPVTGLLHHAWDESRKQLWADPATGRSPHIWGRALGWYCMALVDVLEILPLDHPKRDSLAALFTRTITVVAEYRDQTAKLWYQVLDQGGRPGNYLETSASAMFCYTIAKAVRLGLLESDPYKNFASEAFKALIERYLKVDSAGYASLQGICKVAGLGGNPYRDGSYSYYVGEPVVSDDFKGVGPFILAAVELANLG